MTAKTVWSGRFLEARVDESWEYVVRTGSITEAVILAVDDGHVLLVEQYRVQLGRNCIELAAGLVGDEAENESVEDTAARELAEDPGNRAGYGEARGEIATCAGVIQA